jgi:hypothetical protein
VFFSNFGNSSLAANQTRFAGAGGVGFSATRAEVEFIMTRAGTLRRLTHQANVNGRPNATSVTAMKNGVATALALSVPAGSTALIQDLVNTVSVVAGDRIAIRYVAGAGAGSMSDTASSFEFMS